MLLARTGPGRRLRLLGCVLLAAGLLLLLGTCMLLSFFPGSPLGPGILPVTPEAAARANSPCGGLNPAQSFHVLASVPTPRGKLITYRARCFSVGALGPIEYLGYSYMEMEQDGIFWSDLGGGGWGGGAEPHPGDLVNSAFGSTDNEVIVYGYALDSRVEAVEADFAGGQTVRDDIDGGGVTLRAPGGGDVCEVRVLGAGGKVLSAPDPPPGVMQIVQGQPVRSCP